MPKRAAKKLKFNNKASKNLKKHYKSAASLALKNLIVEVYSILKLPKQFRGKMHDAYLKKLKALKNRLNTGRNWCLI